MNRCTFKMMSALLAVLLAVSACSPSAATPTTTNTNPTAAVVSVPTQVPPTATMPPVAAPTDTPEPQAQVTTVVSQASNAIDACTLVTKDEATQTVGAQVQDGLKDSKQYTAFAQGLGLGGATISSCTYVGQSAAQYVNVIVFQFGGMAGDAVIQEARAKLDQNPEATAISGLGDLAYGMPSTVIVLKGTTAVAVSVVANPQDLAAGNYAKAQALVTVALTRLP